TYVPGVGTRFDEVGDSGEGFSPFTSDRARGLAFAYKGENRIIWALVEAVNNVYRYYTDTPLVDNARFTKEFNKLKLPSGVRPSSGLTAAFTAILEELHDKLKPFVPADMPGKSRDKGQVQAIFVSMFGFSRGAAQARSFANWFIWLCQLDAKLSNRQAVKQPRTLSLGTIDVTFDFLGLFDTVASVGLAASSPVLSVVVDGHGAWSDTEVSLRIPTNPGPTACLHLVSGHEIRRSFPLDSVAYLGNTPPNCKEIVFPGVHSDIGGGYSPLDQGRGTDPQGGDLISRMTLATMYRAARLAGVPLKLESAPEQVRQAFRIDPRAITIFNAYIGYCHAQAGAQPPLRLHKIMEFQHRLYIQWRKKMLGKMMELPNVRNLPASYKSGKFDLTDITMADRELQQEVAEFEAWRKRQALVGDSRPGNPEWMPIAEYWDQAPPPSAVTDLLELFVHDSRAWFKPLGKDIPDLWYALELLAAQEEKARDWEQVRRADAGAVNPYALTEQEKNKLLLYRRVKGTDREMEAIDPDPTGRENGYMGGGYL
ncbi:T6SS phospholipase effector Tle1-like catalytic domain-containing protein, partial [Janthinobacterium agaricidamnosum]|uniref:T6SS phospholipase effector Tle1-like catalytic domain-containing protein n=1 Tax=Janthinobacterium agaricidamnosum TaxID=55508 RepID=UPI00077425C5